MGGKPALGGEGRSTVTPLQILYIAGSYRSGSTLMERIFARDPAFVSLGEVMHLWREGYGWDAPCGCGDPFSQCAFWSAVDRDAFHGLTAGEAERIERLRLRTKHLYWIPRILSHRRWRFRPPWSELDEYLNEVRAIYVAARDRSSASVIIDSSKNIVTGMMLGRLADTSVFVVHLVRDPRGVAYSWMRSQQRLDSHWSREDALAPGACALRWLAVNGLAPLLRLDSTDYLLVRYEDFVSAPDPIVNVVRKRLGLPIAGQPVRSADGTVDLPVTHSIAGNPKRWTERTAPLRIDDQWRSAMPHKERRLVSILTSPLAWHYGYLH